MTTIATTATDAERPHLRPPSFGLSARLIVLTMMFMILAEVLIYLPAAAGFRRSWLGDRLMGTQMIVLALSAAPSGTVSGDVEARLLAGVKGAQAIGVRGSDTRWLLASGGDVPPAVTREIDLREGSWHHALGGVLRNLVAPTPGLTRVIGPGSPGAPGMDWVELILDETPLRTATLAFTRDFLVVSLIISGITSVLLYLALHVIVVRPVRRLSANISGFARNPEDAARIISPSGRTDEIGAAEQALARMETILANELRKKSRLADLGLAVSKINHELRNMLTTAHLLSDRLGELQDPAVRRIAPRLIKTLDRAIEYCGATLAYGRASERPPQRRWVPLKPLVVDQLDLTALSDGHEVSIVIDVSCDLETYADPDQLARILLNLMRNSVEALGQAKTPDARIEVSAARRDRAVLIRVADNGPGIPERVRTRLFSAFQASERSGGTGLGLPVADELARLHGGSISLETSSHGASFLVVVPDGDIA